MGAAGASLVNCCDQQPAQPKTCQLHPAGQQPRHCTPLHTTVALGTHTTIHPAHNSCTGDSQTPASWHTIPALRTHKHQPPWTPLLHWGLKTASQPAPTNAALGTQKHQPATPLLPWGLNPTSLHTSNPLQLLCHLITGFLPGCRRTSRTRFSCCSTSTPTQLLPLSLLSSRDASTGTTRISETFLLRAAA